jgi:two-component system NtrC family response regulator
MTDVVFRILIVDDEMNIRSGLSKALESETYAISTAENGEAAWARFCRESNQLVITDLKMPGSLSGLNLLKRIKHEHPETLVLVITAHGTIETAVEAMRLGAHDFISKPVDLAMLRHQVHRAFEHYQLAEENQRLRQRLTAAGEFPEILGQSAAIREVFIRIQQVADKEVTVLLNGESGTGKELVSRAIHNASPRRNRPFVATNIAALPDTLVESELFGHEKGAFSGAIRKKPGCFEMAEGGTLFLDEVGEMSPKSQVDLLRVLEQREVRRIGGEDLFPVDVRLVAATHADLEEFVEEGKFREDLYYRLNVVPIRVPPLRERRDDVPLLVNHFLRQAEQRHARESKRMSGAAMQILCDYSWPGNVRQLRNLMERLVVTVEDPILHTKDLPPEMRTVPQQVAMTLEVAVGEAEKDAILAALSKCGQHRERAAKILGISVRTLHYKMNRYNLQ